jgi:hypothetical protein
MLIMNQLLNLSINDLLELMIEIDLRMIPVKIGCIERILLLLKINIINMMLKKYH